MVDTNRLRNAYIDFYSEFRKYIWNFETILELANLESIIYTAFYDTGKLITCLNKLKSSMKEILVNDEDLKTSFDNMYELANESSSDDMYVKIIKYKEVVQ